MKKELLKLLQDFIKYKEKENKIRLVQAQELNRLANIDGALGGYNAVLLKGTIDEFYDWLRYNPTNKE